MAGLFLLWVACTPWLFAGGRADSAISAPASGVGLLQQAREDPRVGGSLNATLIKASVVKTCALLDGNPFCWGGRDDRGGLGNGPELSGDQASPSWLDVSVVPKGMAWTSLSIGSNHGCGLTADGTAYCWGSDETGQLGNGPELTDDQHSPSAVDVSGLPAGTTWSAISAGGDTVHEGFSCGITADGAAYCWGEDAGGELGNGPEITGDQVSPSPVDVSGLPAGVTWASIAVFERHACAITTAGVAYCWGADNNGALGNGPDLSHQVSPSPVDTSVLPGGTTWAEISLDFAHTCGLTTDGVAYCWGEDFGGQLGNGPAITEDQESPSPVDVSGLPAGTSWSDIGAGINGGCGITTEGVAYCWGADYQGKLGNGPEITADQHSPSPVDLSELPAGVTWTAVTAGGVHNCGITDNGAAYCWGWDELGQLGNGPDITADQHRPSSPVASVPPDVVVGPDSRDFGDVVVGAAAGPLSATVVNIGTAGDMTIDTISSPPAPFAAAGGTCAEPPFTLPAGGRCTLDYSFSPTALGPAGETVTVTSSGESSPHTISLQGTGITNIVIAPDAVDFGEVFVGASSDPISVTVTNRGVSDLVVSDVSDPGAPFAQAGGSCGVPPFTLAAEATCTLDYSFSPVVAGGPFEASVTVVSDALSSPDAFTMVGTGLSRAILGLTPEAFDVVLETGQTTVEGLEIGNPGDESLDWGITEVGERVLTHSESMTVVQGNGIACVSGGTTVENHFLRAFTLADFGVTTDFGVTEVVFGVDLLTTNATITVNLYELEGELTFDNLELLGSTTVDLFAQALSLVTVPITGTAPADSTLVVEIVAPSFAGLQAEGSGGHFEGRGVLGGFGFWPGTNDLGETAPSYLSSPEESCGLPEPTPFSEIGFPNVHLVMTVTGTTVDCTLPAWAGVDPLDGAVPAGSSQTADVTFDAGGLEPGVFDAHLCLESNDPLRPFASVPLTLTVSGSGAALALNPSSLDFGDVPVGETSAPQNATLHNVGDADATGITFSGLPEAGFEADSSGCGATLPAGGSCVVSVTFTPPVAGPATATLHVDSAEGATADLGLSGAGAEPGADITPESFSFEVEQGDGDSDTLVVGNIGADDLTWSIDEGGEGCDAPTDIPWLSSDPISGTTTPGAITPVEVTVDTTDLEAGEHTARLCVNTNDPQTPLVEVPVNLTVTRPIADITPESFSFEVPQGGTDSSTLNVGNIGDADLAWSIDQGEDIVVFDDINFTVPVDNVGGSVQWNTGETCECETEPFDFNMWASIEDRLTFFWPEIDGVRGSGVSLDGGSSESATYAVLEPGATIGPDSVFIAFAGNVNSVNWRQPDGVDGFLGFQFVNPDTGETNFGYARITTTGTTGHPATVVGWAYNQAGDPITIPGDGGEGCDALTDIPWLSSDPTIGTTAPGMSTPVDVTVDATDLEVGEHTAQLCVNTNDRERPLIEVPLTLTVTEGNGTPELGFDPSSLDFGDVEVGDTSPPALATLHNTGDADATGLVFDPPGNAFDADTGGCGDTLPAGGSCDISVTFTPTEAGPAAASLGVTSAEDASAFLPLTGTGVGGGGLTAMGLVVDPEQRVSDGNDVFEPGEQVTVAPAWRNDGEAAQSLMGTASSFTGPEGADYVLAADAADYGLLDPGQTASCLDGGDSGVCYELGLNAPAARPAMHWEATFEETLSDSEETSKTWTLHLGDSFADVPRESLFYRAIETLLHSGVASGCGGSEYCPQGVNTRSQMAVFLLKAVEGGDYLPPACEEGEERFLDVAADNLFCSWIEELAAREITTGCGGDNFCPGDSVTRAQMAVFLLKAALGSGYTPPACTEEFADVPCSSIFAAWIEELAERGITSGCGGDDYCPADAVTRAQMAVFVTKAFGLTLYGP